MPCRSAWKWSVYFGISEYLTEILWHLPLYHPPLWQGWINQDHDFWHEWNWIDSYNYPRLHFALVTERHPEILVYPRTLKAIIASFGRRSSATTRLMSCSASRSNQGQSGRISGLIC
jgi:hypothetical protein